MGDPILDVMSKSPLADIPWAYITEDQIQRTMAGEVILPTPLQKKLALIDGYSSRDLRAAAATRKYMRKARVESRKTA